MSKEEEVLEFLDLLPEEQKSAANTANATDADILDFLDELAQESTGTLKPKGAKDEPKDKEQVAEEKQKPETHQDILAKQPEPAKSLEESASGGTGFLGLFWGQALSVVDGLSKTAQETVSDLSRVANTQLKELPDYEKLETLGRSLNDQGKQVGGIFLSFVNTLNEQLVATTQQDEVLKLFIINDALKGFDYLDYLVYHKFERVVGQVEGSVGLEILNLKNFSRLLSILDIAHFSEADHDMKPKNIEFFSGAGIDAEKLAFANIDDGIKSLMAMKRAGSKGSQRVSHVFLSIVPVMVDKKATYETSFEESVRIGESEKCFYFLVVLKDLEHKFSIVAKSQSFPIKWATWLTENSLGEDKEGFEGLEPAEWVKDWIREGLGLVFGVVAQSYVSKRMGL